MVKAGAMAYVVKSASERELIRALRAVASGKRYLWEGAPLLRLAVLRAVELRDALSPSAFHPSGPARARIGWRCQPDSSGFCDAH
jgi:hypothetical protein